MEGIYSEILNVAQIQSQLSVAISRLTDSLLKYKECSNEGGCRAVGSTQPPPPPRLDSIVSDSSNDITEVGISLKMTPVSKVIDDDDEYESIVTDEIFYYLKQPISKITSAAISGITGVNVAERIHQFVSTSTLDTGAAPVVASFGATVISEWSSSSSDESG